MPIYFINDISDGKVLRNSSREDELLSSCSSFCPDLLQGSPRRHPSNNSQTNNFSKKIVVRGQITNKVVDSQFTPVEWASSSLAFPISDHNNRCCPNWGTGVSCNKRKTHGGGL